MNTSNNNLIDFLIDWIGGIWAFLLRHLKIVLPVAVGILTLIVLIASVSAHNRKTKQAETQEAQTPEVESLIDTNSAIVAVPEVALEEDMYPAVNELINKYYTAMADGDIDTVHALNNNVDDTETIRIEETAKYIEKYESIKVYTKIGPSEGTYLAYVYSQMKFKDYEDSIPGLEAFYICTDENGSLYINDGEESESVINYIREASLQDDVVDLNNEVASAYNTMLADNEDLSVFLVDLTESIDTAVGESLAQAEGDALSVGTDSSEAEAEPEEEEEAAATETQTVKTVRTTTTVNIRSSDSETADKLGKATEGQEFKLVEARGNGWSEIEYNGSTAFIKSEYLETASEETIVNVPQDDQNTTASNQNETSSDSGKTTVSGTVKVIENVRIRSNPSTEADKLGTAYPGQKLDFVEKLSNGWTKIKYEGKIAYVKSEYVE